MNCFSPLRLTVLITALFQHSPLFAMAMTLSDIFFWAGVVGQLVLPCCINYMYAPTPPDTERNLNQAQHDIGADKKSGHGLADVYVLVSRTAQSQTPLLTERIRNRLSNKMPAFTKHWAIRATWANGDDKVWQIFQANRLVMSPRCSDYNAVRRHLRHCHHVGQTHYSMEEISRIGISTQVSS
jgi:hypothetical protein